MKSWFRAEDQSDDGILSEKALYRNRPAKRALIILLFLAVVAVVLVVGSLHGGPSLTGSQTLDGTTRGGGSGSHTTSDRTASDRAKDQRMSRCERVFADQRQAMQAAGSALAQWQVHVDAMNQLVLGAITLQQATQFWNQTRVGANARLESFASADGRLNQLTIRCPTPVGSAPKRLLACERAVAANDRVLYLARTALETWRAHVHDMEMLRTGMMSGARASQMWLQSWHEGQDQITRYRAAVKTSHGLHCS